MMKIATGEGYPLRQGAVTGLDWFSVATEASGGGTPDLLCSPKFLGYMGIYVPRSFQVTRGQPRTLLVQLRYSVGFFWSKNKFREVLGQLDSV